MRKKFIKRGTIIYLFVICAFLSNNIEALTTYDITRGIFEHVIYKTDSQIGENSQISTIIVVSFTVILFIYWLVLLIMYEREEEYIGTNYLQDEEIFKKYNPLLAGCIAQNRNVLSRDIIAVILNLSSKGIIKLDITRDIESKNGYKYTVYRIREKEHLMDDVEKEIHSIIFEFVQSEKEGIDLVKKLRDIPKIKESYIRFKNLDNIAKYELNKLGANNEGVPKPFRIYNILLFTISIVLCCYHIKEIGFDMQITVSALLIIGLIVSLILISIPLVIAFCYLVLKLIGYTKKSINNINEIQFYGQKIVSQSILIIISTLVNIIIVAITTRNTYLVLDVVLIGMSYLIIKTDNLMIKNDKEFLNEYMSIKMLYKRLEEYTTLNQKNIEHINLWKEYLSYSIAFGISTNIVGYLDGLRSEDKLIEELKNYDLLYYSCKNYLEVLWGFTFNKNRKYKRKQYNNLKDTMLCDYDEIERKMIMDNWLDGKNRVF